MMQAHHASSRVMSPELQVFQVTQTDTSMQRVWFTQLRPVTTGINPTEFLVPATDAFLDLNRSYFELELRLKTSANANLAHNTVLYPVTNLAHTLIKQLSVHVKRAVGTSDGSLPLQSLLPDPAQQQPR